MLGYVNAMIWAAVAVVCFAAVAFLAIAVVGHFFKGWKDEGG